MGPPQVGFFFRAETPIDFLMLVSCNGICFLLSGSKACSPMGLNWWDFHHSNPSEYMHGTICVCGTCHEHTKWLFPPLIWVRGASYYSSCHSVIQSIWWSIQLWGPGRVTWSLCLPHIWEGSSLPGFVPTSGMFDLESAEGIKFGDSSVVIGHQVDEFTHTLSAVFCCQIIHLPWVHKQSVNSHVPLEPGCEDYSFLDQAVADFEQGLDSILTYSVQSVKQ